MIDGPGRVEDDGGEEDDAGVSLDMRLRAHRRGSNVVGVNTG
jgi:hypothetical protein